MIVRGQRSRDGYCNGFAAVPVDCRKAVFFRRGKAGRTVNRILRLAGRGTEEKSGRLLNGFAAVPVDCRKTVFFFGEEKRGELSTGFFGLRREARKRSLDGYCNGFATVTVDCRKTVFFRRGKAERTVNRIFRLAGRGTEEKSGRVLQRVCRRAALIAEKPFFFG